MKINRICPVYFSATGTTKKIVTSIANAVRDTLTQSGTDALSFYEVDFSLPKARELSYTFSETDLVICGLPTYAGRIPNLLLPFVQNNLLGNNTPFIPVALFGNRNFDDCLMELKITMEEKGFTAVAAGAFVGEHSFSKTLGAGRPNTDDLNEATLLGCMAGKKILELDTIREVAPLTITGNIPIRPYYKPQDRNGNFINILKVKPKTNDNCNGCGLCASVCTMGSISQDNPRDVIGTCTKCCACVKACPTGAKYYDDEGYLYHKSELEEVYSRPAKNEIFY